MLDPRFGRLGELLGETSDEGQQARGLFRMAKLWTLCTYRQSHTLPMEDIERVIGRPIGDLLNIGLVKQTADGFYVSGTRGRIEWYGKKLKASKLGNAVLRKKTRKLHANPIGLTYRETPPTPTPTPTPADSERERESRVPPSTTDPNTDKTNGDPHTGPDKDLHAVELKAAREKIYEAYPRHEGRRAGFAKLEKLGLEELRECYRAVRNYDALISSDGRKKDGCVQLFSTFMGRWQDYLEAQPAQESKNSTLERIWAEADAGGKQ